MPQEQHVRQRHQNQLFNQRVTQRVDSMIDEDAAVVERNDRDALRQPRLNLVNFLLDRVDHLARIGAVADDDHAAHGLFAILVENAAAKLRAELDAAHIADGDRRAVESAKRDILNILQAADQPDAANHLFGVARPRPPLRPHCYCSAPLRKPHP